MLKMREKIDTLMDQDYKTFVKSFISLETGVEDERVLEQVAEDFLINMPYSSLVNEDLYRKASSLEQRKDINKLEKSKLSIRSHSV